MSPRVLPIIFIIILAAILSMTLMGVEIAGQRALTDAIQRQKMALEGRVKKIQREQKTIGNKLKKLQRENARLKQERNELNRNCVLRTKVQMIDDIPTRSMRKYCRDMAEAWVHVLPMLDKLGIVLGMPNEQEKAQ